MRVTDGVEASVIRNSETLKRIAVVLGETETAFFDSTVVEIELADTCEMLRIWNGLERVADRRKVLTFLRAIAAQA